MMKLMKKTTKKSVRKTQTSWYNVRTMVVQHVETNAVDQQGGVHFALFNVAQRRKHCMNTRHYGLALNEIYRKPMIIKIISDLLRLPSNVGSPCIVLNMYLLRNK
uniref:Uncharacterized protein n=1 Tax=Romanomermis culicivorax TaxID=13658 RepID=A0A915KM66_ROMCU